MMDKKYMLAQSTLIAENINLAARYSRYSDCRHIYRHPDGRIFVTSEGRRSIESFDSAENFLLNRVPDMENAKALAELLGVRLVAVEAEAVKKAFGS